MTQSPSSTADSHQRMLIEQLRLLMATTKSSIIPVILLVLLLLSVLMNPHNRLALSLWAVCAVGSKLLCAIHAKMTLKQLDAHLYPQKIVWRLFTLYFFDAAVLGVR